MGENCRRKPKLKVDENDVLGESEILGRFYLHGDLTPQVRYETFISR